MYYQLTSYIRHHFQATNQHGIHSPFVYDLVSNCFYDRTSYSEYNLLNDYRNRLNQSEDLIAVIDMGAGSRVFKGKKRKVSAIAKHAGVDVKRQRLLFRLCRYLNVEHALELGTSLGLSTAALSLGVEQGSVVTVEGCPNTTAYAQSLFNEFEMKNIELENKDFMTFCTNDSKDSYDLIYLDGDHQKTSTLTYFEHFLKQVHNDTLLILDDIYWSKEMTEAWLEIIARQEVTVSIDTYFWGMVFFRKEQRKQHFKIRL